MHGHLPRKFRQIMFIDCLGWKVSDDMLDKKKWLINPKSWSQKKAGDAFGGRAKCPKTGEKIVEREEDIEHRQDFMRKALKRGESYVIDKDGKTRDARNPLSSSKSKSKDNDDNLSTATNRDDEEDEDIDNAMKSVAVAEREMRNNPKLAAKKKVSFAFETPDVADFVKQALLAAHLDPDTWGNVVEHFCELNQYLDTWEAKTATTVRILKSTGESLDTDSYNDLESNPSDPFSPSPRNSRSSANRGLAPARAALNEMKGTLHALFPDSMERSLDPDNSENVDREQRESLIDSNEEKIDLEGEDRQTIADTDIYRKTSRQSGNDRNTRFARNTARSSEAGNSPRSPKRASTFAGLNDTDAGDNPLAHRPTAVSLFARMGEAREKLDEIEDILTEALEKYKLGDLLSFADRKRREVAKWVLCNDYDPTTGMYMPYYLFKDGKTVQYAVPDTPFMTDSFIQSEIDALKVEVDGLNMSDGCSIWENKKREIYEMKIGSILALEKKKEAEKKAMISEAEVARKKELEDERTKKHESAMKKYNSKTMRAMRWLARRRKIYETPNVIREIDTMERSAEEANNIPMRIFSKACLILLLAWVVGFFRNVLDQMAHFEEHLEIPEAVELPWPKDMSKDKHLGYLAGSGSNANFSGALGQVAESIACNEWCEGFVVASFYGVSHYSHEQCGPNLTEFINQEASKHLRHSPVTKNSGFDGRYYQESLEAVEILDIGLDSQCRPLVLLESAVVRCTGKGSAQYIPIEGTWASKPLKPTAISANPDTDDLIMSVDHKDFPTVLVMQFGVGDNFVNHGHYLTLRPMMELYPTTTMEFKSRYAKYKDWESAGLETRMLVQDEDRLVPKSLFITYDRDYLDFYKKLPNYRSPHVPKDEVDFLKRMRDEEKGKDVFTYLQRAPMKNKHKGPIHRQPRDGARKYVLNLTTDSYFAVFNGISKMRKINNLHVRAVCLTRPNLQRDSFNTNDSEKMTSEEKANNNEDENAPLFKKFIEGREKNQPYIILGIMEKADVPPTEARYNRRYQHHHKLRRSLVAYKYEDILKDESSGFLYHMETDQGFHEFKNTEGLLEQDNFDQQGRAQVDQKFVSREESVEEQMSERQDPLADDGRSFIENDLENDAIPGYGFDTGADDYDYHR